MRSSANNEKVDVNGNQSIGCVVCANHREMPVAPSRVKQDEVFTVLCQRQCDVGDALTNVGCIVHYLKPTIRVFVFKNRFIPSGRIGHAWVHHRLIDETGGACIDRKADELFVFEDGAFCRLFHERDHFPEGFDFRRENYRGVGFSDVRAVLMLADIGQSNHHGKRSSWCGNGGCFRIEEDKRITGNESAAWECQITARHREHVPHAVFRLNGDVVLQCRPRTVVGPNVLRRCRLFEEAREDAHHLHV
jgi:hypothetical protein